MACTSLIIDDVVFIREKVVSVKDRRNSEYKDLILRLDGDVTHVFRGEEADRVWNWAKRDAVKV